MFSTARYNLIPSFFKTMVYLKKQKREFAVVLRGESDDVEEAIFEFNKFCEGDHPCYSGRSGTAAIKFDGSKNNKRCIINKRSQGIFYKFPIAKALILGVSNINEEAATPRDMEDYFFDENISEDDRPKVLHENIDCYCEMMERFKYTCGMALTEMPDSKRTLLVDQADYNTLHIFFDSKLGLGDQCRLDVRDVITNKPIPFKNFINIYAAVVEPHRAILESDYFMKLIEMCEMTRDAEIAARESGEEFEQGQSVFLQPKGEEEEGVNEPEQAEEDPF